MLSLGLGMVKPCRATGDFSTTIRIPRPGPPVVSTFTVSFLGEGSPTNIDHRKKGTLILTSLPEDLAVVPGVSETMAKPSGRALEGSSTDASAEVSLPNFTSSCTLNCLGGPFSGKQQLGTFVGQST